MHSSQHKLCARKTELALIMKFYLDFAMATNVHTKYIFPRCLDRERFGLSGQSIKGAWGTKRVFTCYETAGFFWLGRVWKKFPVDL